MSTEGLDLPGVPDPAPAQEGQFAIEDGEERGKEHLDSDAESGTDDPFPDDESQFEKTYIAIDGLESTELSDEQKDALESSIADLLLLDFQFPITGVRVIAGDSYVVEYDRD